VIETFAAGGAAFTIDARDITAAETCCTLHVRPQDEMQVSGIDVTVRDDGVLGEGGEGGQKTRFSRATLAAYYNQFLQCSPFILSRRNGGNFYHASVVTRSANSSSSFPTRRA
jgi:hypothetical protein